MFRLGVSEVVLGQRILTGAAGILLVVLAVWLGGFWLAAFFAFIAVIITYEIGNMMKVRPSSAESLIALFCTALIVLWPAFERFWYVLFYSLLLLTVFRREAFSFSNAGVLFAAALYSSYAFRTLLNLRTWPSGAGWVLLVFIAIWATDTGAFFSGRALGGPKLAPDVSPKKTISGAVGGLLAAMLFTVGGGLLMFRSLAGSWALFAVLGLIVSVAGQAGDLVESALKRQYAVKDSGTILPGHGGALDRFDSLLLAAPIAYHFIIWVFPH